MFGIGQASITGTKTAAEIIAEERAWREAVREAQKGPALTTQVELADPAYISTAIENATDSYVGRISDWRFVVTHPGPATVQWSEPNGLTDWDEEPSEEETVATLRLQVESLTAKLEALTPKPLPEKPKIPASALSPVSHDVRMGAARWMGEP